MKTRRNRKQRGGYEAMGQPLGYVDPKWNAPSASAGVNVQEATQTIVREPLKATMGGSRRQRKSQGGFYPSVMGGVVGGAPILLPVAIRQGINLFSKYRKSTRKNSRKQRKSRRSHRKF
jgi:hypothetical protein